MTDNVTKLAGQVDLGAGVMLLTGEDLWSIQRDVATALSRPRAKVAVPSCNASGKTHLAARLALSFYNAYTPGAPCMSCDPTGRRGGCRGSKIITTSSKESHLKDNLWGELRTAFARAQANGQQLPGKLYEGDLRLVEDEYNHLVIGQSAATAEGMQGYHAAHKLIIGDEATSVEDDVALAITRLLASGDSRILLIYNPTTPDTYAAKMAKSPEYETVRITAWDTPAFTAEPVPLGANLITPSFLEDLKGAGMGPGTFEWVTSIEAKDWETGDDLLIPAAWYDRVANQQPYFGAGIRQLGVDIAAYGSDENVIAVRNGDQLIDVRAYPSMRPDDYVRGPVTEAVMRYQPQIVCFDADGVGAGAIGHFDDLTRLASGLQILPFRGGLRPKGRYHNQRGQAYWELRRRFESQSIQIAIRDEKLSDQITDIHYSVTPEGRIRVETKQEMRKRGVTSPDRADALMYAFAFAGDIPIREPQPASASEHFGATDFSEKAMWEAIVAQQNRQARSRAVNAVLGVPD